MEIRNNLSFDLTVSLGELGVGREFNTLIETKRRKAKGISPPPSRTNNEIDRTNDTVLSCLFLI
jgi:hypothetical protein